MTTSLEEELTRALQRHAALVETAPAYRLGRADRPDGARVRTRRPTGARRSWAPMASAVAVAVAAAALAVAAWLGTEKHAPEPQHVLRCAASSRFVPQLRSGALPAGEEVLAGTGSGTLLVAVQSNGATRAVETIEKNGQVTLLWTAGRNERVRAVANPSGGITGFWATFVLKPVVGTGVARVLAADLSTAAVIELIADPGYVVTADPPLAPLIGDDAVNVFETSRSDPRVQQVAVFWPASAPRTSDVRVRTADAHSWYPVGGNVVTVQSRPGGSVNLDFDQPQYLPSTLEPAARSGFGFASDGTTLTWLTRSGDRYYRWQWAPGDPSPLRRAVTASGRPVATTGRFVVLGAASAHAARRVFDSSTGKIIELPSGISLVRVDGPTVTLADHAAGGRYFRVPVAALLAC